MSGGDWLSNFATYSNTIGMLIVIALCAWLLMR